MAVAVGLRIVCAATVLAAALWTVPALAACAPTPECLEEIEQAHRDTRTLTARFVQTKHLTLLDAPLVSRGRFALKRPDRLLWRVEDPEPLSVVIDGGELRVPGGRPAMTGAPVAAVAGWLGSMFAGDVRSLERAFDVSAREDEGAVEVQLRPREAAWRRFFTVAELRFARPALTLAAIRLRDALGDSVEIELHDVRRNDEVPDSTFAIDAHQR